MNAEWGFTCWDDMEETGISLVADSVAGPTGDHSKVQFWFGWITQDTVGATTAEKRTIQQQSIATTRYQHRAVTCYKFQSNFNDETKHQSGRNKVESSQINTMLSDLTEIV